MVYYKISEGTYYLSVSAEEAALYGFEDNKRSSPAALRAIIKSVLPSEDADKSCDKMIISLFVSRSGECAVFVKIVPYFEKLSENYPYIYVFDSFEYLLEYCTTVPPDMGILMFFDCKGKYYLATEKSVVYASEFYARRCSPAVYNYLQEHCRIVGKTCAKVLAKLAVKH